MVPATFEASQIQTRGIPPATWTADEETRQVGSGRPEHAERRVPLSVLRFHLGYSTYRNTDLYPRLDERQLDGGGALSLAKLATPSLGRFGREAATFKDQASIRRRRRLGHRPGHRKRQPGQASPWFAGGSANGSDGTRTRGLRRDRPGPLISSGCQARNGSVKGGLGTTE